MPNKLAPRADEFAITNPAKLPPAYVFAAVLSVTLKRADPPADKKWTLAKSVVELFVTLSASFGPQGMGRPSVTQLLPFSQ
ncbi:hypothetical protein GCM10028774_07290 [Spirosoma jeollabukense]